MDKYYHKTKSELIEEIARLETRLTTKDMVIKQLNDKIAHLKSKVRVVVR